MRYIQGQLARLSPRSSKVKFQKSRLRGFRPEPNRALTTLRLRFTMEDPANKECVEPHVIE